jgi:hypothetical protein
MFRRGLSAVSERATAHQTTLWGVAVAALFLDVGTTTYGLRLGLTESNPVVNYLLPTLGLAGTFTLLKGWALTLGLIAWTVMPATHRGLVPLGLALPWSVAVVNNSLLLLSVHL